MKTKLWVGSLLLVGLAGCEGTVVAERPYHHRPAAVVYAQPAPVVVAQPAPTAYPPAPPPPAAPPSASYTPPPAPVSPDVAVAQPAPTFVEEGSVVGGVVVTPIAPSDYVFVNGGWYYWHPGIRRWVHARRPEGWRPPARPRVPRLG